MDRFKNKNKNLLIYGNRCKYVIVLTRNDDCQPKI